jgi:hypothetical protein
MQTFSHWLYLLFVDDFANRIKLQVRILALHVFNRISGREPLLTCASENLSNVIVAKLLFIKQSVGAQLRENFVRDEFADWVSHLFLRLSFS